jgi:hypothetical protein
MHRSITLFCLVAGVMAAEAGSTVTYDATYANWLSQSWQVAGNTPTHGTLVQAGQDIDPGLIHRFTYRNVESVGLKPFVSVAAGSESKYANVLGGIDIAFDNGLLLSTQVEYGTTTVQTWTLDAGGTKQEYDGKSLYTSALVSLGSETWGGYFVMRRHKVPNLLTVREVSSGVISPGNAILDLYYDKDYAITTANLGIYVDLSTACGPGSIRLGLNAGVGPGFSSVGDDAKDQVDADWNHDTTASKARWGFDAAVDLGYEQRIFGAGLFGFGVRGVAFGNIDAISGGSHGDAKPVGSDYSWDLVSSRMDGFFGPYLRIGAVF